MGNAREAALSSGGDTTSFTVGDYVIRFKTPRNLLRYEKILAWDGGYIERLALYDDPPVAEGDRIGSAPNLENLHFDPETFPRGMEKVRIQQA